MRRRHQREAASVAVNPAAAGSATRAIAGSDLKQRRQRATEDEIRILAHHKWVIAGQPEGDGVSFWIEAERELLKGNQS